MSFWAVPRAKAWRVMVMRHVSWFWKRTQICLPEALKLQGCFLFIKVERYWYNGVPSPSLARPCILQLYFESGNMLPDSKYSCNIQGRAKLGLGTPLYQYRSTFINKKQPCNFRASGRQICVRFQNHETWRMTMTLHAFARGTAQNDIFCYDRTATSNRGKLP